MEQTFFVLDPSPIVVMDLVGMLKGAFPSAFIRTFTSLADLNDDLRYINKSSVLLINGRWCSETSEALLRQITEQGAQIVSLGKPNDADFPMRLIDVPFTTKTVLEMLVNDVFDPLVRRPANRT